MADAKTPDDSPVLHVVVVGFHHKKGCQVEYSYPPLIPGNEVDSHDVPEKWKHLPSLALPDGAHNYVNDTVYFHLPSQDGSLKTVYGVSCYRQMDAQKLINRTADVTRSTVQKSVCVLSKLPLYGLIKAKLELITHAYFDERDFSKVDLLRDTFNNLSQGLTEGLLDGSQVFLGLSAREAVITFKHKIVVLFKLLLLERKILFFGSPVETLSSTLLSVLSLFPNMIEFGLEESVVKQVREISPTLEKAVFSSEDEEGFLEVRYSEKDKNLSDISMHLPKEPFKRSNSVEPQSPTIPRDGSLDPEQSDTDKDLVQSKNQSSKALKNSENEQLKMSVECDKPKPARPRSLSGGHEHAKVHDLAKVKKHKDSIDNPLETDTESNPIDVKSETDRGKRESAQGFSEIVYCKDDSPLQQISSITQVEAVQTGKTFPNDSQKIEEYSREIELGTSPSGIDPRPELLTLSPEDKDPLLALKRTDSFEDLDSPESISRIDKEDCFSWEDDRVLLSIDHEEVKDGQTDKGDNSDSGKLQKLSSLDEKSVGSLASEKNSPKSVSSEKSGTSRSSRHASPGAKAAALKSKLSSAFGNLHIKGKGRGTNPIEMKSMSLEESQLYQDNLGFPLAIFTKGSICHPYLSLQYHDILHDLNIRSFVIGATNILFKQRRTLLDVIVEISEGKVEIIDKELQKQLHLTTADLRFADYLVKTVVEDTSDIYLNGTVLFPEWEGGDEWIRAQFRLYAQSLVATILCEDPKQLDDFGPSFIQAWRTTQNFKFCFKSEHSALKDIPTGHPYQGHLNVADLRMRLSHNLQSTEGGKKINAAVVQTGKYVVQTGKAVGGAISNARSALSSWFGGFSDKSKTSPSQSTEGLSEAESS